VIHGSTTGIDANAIQLKIAAQVIHGSTTKNSAVLAIPRKSAVHKMVTHIPTTNTVFAIQQLTAVSILVTHTTTTPRTANARARNSAALDRPGEKIVSALVIP